MEDDDISLSSDTMKALQEFLAEQKQREEQEKQLVEQQQAEVNPLLKEDWNLSQFWYTDETSLKIAQEAIDHANGGPIACISTPSIFRALKTLNPPNDFYVFEYDKRFALYGKQFVFYDYNEPTSFSSELKNHFSFIVLDPPFLAEECFAKVAKTVEFLVKNEETPVMACTGAVMEPHIVRLFKNMRVANYKPLHQKQQLQNEFACFVNYKTNL